MKRFLAIILCFIMVLSSAVSVFASTGHNHTITIHNPNEGYTYKAYQIFSGDLNTDGVLSNIEWGSGINGDAFLTELKATHAEFAGCEDAAAVAVILAGAEAMDDPHAIAFAEIAAKHVNPAGAKEATWNDTEDHYLITGLEDGYYLVINDGVPSGEANTTYSRYILEVVRDIGVTHKGTFPTVEKKIIEASLELDEGEASIGEDVVFQITGTLPETLDTYLTYYYAFHDTLSKGFTYNNDMIITVNDVVVTEYFYIEASAYDEVNGTTIYAGIQDLIALELLDDPDVGDITKNTKVVITYSAKVNENAIVVGEGNPNKVYLEYDNNPNTEGTPTLPPPNPDKPTPPDPTGVTPEDEVKVYTTELTILKKDGAGNVLTGAEFTLSGTAVKTMIVTRKEFKEVEAGTGDYWLLKNGDYTDVAPVTEDNPDTTDIDERTADKYASLTADHVIDTIEEMVLDSEAVEVKGYVGEDGRITFTGLGAGEYTLTESVTPAGFNTIDPINFTVTFDSASKKFACANNWIMLEADNTLYAEIINVAGSTLPSTGGIGTTIFYILGGILVAGSLVFLVTKKRMSE